MLTLLERMMNWVLGGSTLLDECEVTFVNAPTSTRTAQLQRLI